MADALEISGQATHDGDRWFVQDPIAVDLTVTDPSGGALSNASVTVGLIKHSDDTVEDTADATTDSEGTVSVSLTTTEATIYDIVASASTGSRQGYAQIAVEDAAEQPPIDIPGITAPSLSDATASSSGTTTLSASVDTDTAQGDLALVAVTTTQPSDDQILAGENANGNTAAFAETVQPASTGSKSFLPDGLSPNTQYDLYWIQEDAGTRSAVVSATATTDALALDAAISLTDNDPTADVSANVTGGVPPYSYEWTWGDGSPTGSGQTASHTYDIDGDYTLVLTVTGDKGDSDTAAITVTITGASPPQVTGLAAILITNDEAALSWNTAESATQYEVQRKRSISSTWTTIATVSNTTSFTDSGLSSDTDYEYRVRGVDASGDAGPYSTVETVKTTSDEGTAVFTMS